jgi:hypothetical protein
MAPVRALPRLPRRDAAAREHLDALGRRARPSVAAHQRAVALGGELASLIPGGALVRGSVVGVDGPPGAGATSLALELAAAITAVGEWAAVVDPDGTIGGRAAAEAGVALERFAVVRRVPPTRWATVVAALLDGVSLVIAEPPRAMSPADARRLVARAREREAVLVVRPRAWPADIGYTVWADASEWADPTVTGMLTERRLQVRVEGRGAAARPRHGELARAV